MPVFFLTQFLFAMAGKIFEKLMALLILLFGLLSVAEAQSSDRAYRIDTFQTTAYPSVNVTTSGGSVDVIGHAENEVKVEMFVRRGLRYLSPSDTDLSDFEINIQKDGDRVIAEAQRKRSGIFRGFRNVSISFRVHVPQNAQVEGKTSGGSVSAENVMNGVFLSTSGGSVTAKKVEGDIELRTSGGSITIEDASGNIQARTSGGTIRASDLFGEAELRTSGGSIRLDNISAKLSARTSGGSIRGSFSTFYDDIDLQTSGGSIRIDIPETEHFDLDLSGQRVEAQLQNFSGDFERNLVKGKIGNGGPLLSAKTSGGSVRLRYN
jgi:DUF4097 and DUF4098 domain-containing protein YvlB